MAPPGSISSLARTSMYFESSRFHPCRRRSRSAGNSHGRSGRARVLTRRGAHPGVSGFAFVILFLGEAWLNSVLLFVPPRPERILSVRPPSLGIPALSPRQIL